MSLARVSDPGVSGGDRVLGALKLLAECPRGLRLEDARKGLGSTKSTTHRVLSTLCRSGLVVRDDDSRYRLSTEFLRLAFAYYDGLDDRDIVSGALTALGDCFGETAYYARLDGPEVVYLAMVTAPGALHTASVVGARAPAYRTGLGKALLAHSLRDRPSVERFVAEYGPLRAATPNSLTNAASLDRELAATRARGWAVDDEENELGVVCVAFPIFLGPTRQPTGAISVAAIKVRTPLETLMTRADEVRELLERHIGAGVLGWDPPRSSAADT